MEPPLCKPGGAAASGQLLAAFSGDALTGSYLPRNRGSEPQPWTEQGPGSGSGGGSWGTCRARCLLELHIRRFLLGLLLTGRLVWPVSGLYS